MNERTVFGEVYLTRQGVCAELGITLPTIAAAEKRDGLQSVRIGRHVAYRKADILDWIARRRKREVAA